MAHLPCKVIRLTDTCLIAKDENFNLYRLTSSQAVIDRLMSKYEEARVELLDKRSHYAGVITH